jgi:hypothetical protein
VKPLPRVWTWATHQLPGALGCWKGDGKDSHFLIGWAAAVSPAEPWLIAVSGHLVNWLRAWGWGKQVAVTVEMLGGF